MSDSKIIAAEEVKPTDPAAAEVPADPNRITAKCGCFRAVVKRMRPKFSEDEKTMGQPVLDADGGFVMEEAEDIEEGYCEEHSVELNRRQLEVQRMLQAGEDPEQAMKLMAAPLLELDAPCDGLHPNTAGPAPSIDGLILRSDKAHQKGVTRSADGCFYWCVCGETFGNDEQARDAHYDALLVETLFGPEASK